MDRSFLSAPDVIDAARDFVCVRLMSYESAEEGRFLESLFRTRSGELENTVFAILAPDGKTRLVRAGRSPRMVFGNDGVREMVAAMRRIAKRYPGKAGATGRAKASGASRASGASGASAEPDATRPLPYVADLRLGINVAACDGLPLAVTIAHDATGTKELERTLARLAWSDAYAGRFIHVIVRDTRELKAIRGAKRSDGLLLVAPDAFGMSGSALSQVDMKANASGIEMALKEALRQFHVQPKDARRHIREGHRQGVHWETKIPVTDPGIAPGGPPPH